MKVIIKEYNGKGRHYPLCEECKKNIKPKEKYINKYNPGRKIHLTCHIKKEEEFLKKLKYLINN